MRDFRDWLAEIAKAITAFIVPAYALWNGARLEGSPGGLTVTTDEWVSILVTGIVAGVAVWLVPNQEEKP